MSGLEVVLLISQIDLYVGGVFAALFLVGLFWKPRVLNELPWRERLAIHYIPFSKGHPRIDLKQIKWYHRLWLLIFALVFLRIALSTSNLVIVHLLEQHMIGGDSCPSVIMPGSDSK